jgi:hypothetical protein
MIIAVDFDGTLALHEYPQIGAEVPYAIDWLRKFHNAGVSIILWTMRHGKTLDEALDWCKGRGLTFWGVNKNPEQHTWTQSNKQYANLYIDDAAVGCPLLPGKDGGRPYVDWSIVGPHTAFLLGLIKTKPDVVSALGGFSKKESVPMSEITDSFNELKLLVSAAEADIAKADSGTYAAGTRSRAQMMLIKKKAQQVRDAVLAKRKEPVGTTENKSGS